MLKTDIRVIGTEYNTGDMIIDTVEPCNGFTVTDDEGWFTAYAVGDQYRDGKIADCFVHPESDCIFMVVECNGVYFEVYFNNYKEYKLQWEPLPFN